MFDQGEKKLCQKKALATACGADNMPVGVGLGEADSQGEPENWQGTKRPNGKSWRGYAGKQCREPVHRSWPSSITSSEVFDSLNACCQIGERYIVVGLAVIVSRLVKKNRSPLS